ESTARVQRNRPSRSAYRKHAARAWIYRRRRTLRRKRGNKPSVTNGAPARNLRNDVRARRQKRSSVRDTARLQRKHFHARPARPRRSARQLRVLVRRRKLRRRERNNPCSLSPGFVDSRRSHRLLCYPVNQTGDKPQNNPKHTTVAIIPARFASTRLPGKALIDIAGKPMVCWVAERARAARNVDRVIVATDSNEIVEAVRARGIEAVLTNRQHTSGTDRVAEVAKQIPEAEIIVNVQGDEPMISPQTIERAVDVMAVEMRKPSGGAGIVTTWEPID